LPALFKECPLSWRKCTLSSKMPAQEGNARPLHKMPALFINMPALSIKMPTLFKECPRSWRKCTLSSKMPAQEGNARSQEGNARPKHESARSLQRNSPRLGLFLKRSLVSLKSVP